MSPPLRSLVRVRPSHIANIPRLLHRSAAVAPPTFRALSTRSTTRPSRSTHTTITTTRFSSSSSSSPTDQPAPASEPKSNDRSDLKATSLSLEDLDLLLENTHWRLTPDGTGLERIYVFQSPQRAAEFCASVFGWSQARSHDPEWAGCRECVYVRWTTHKPPGLSRADIEGAMACERFDDGANDVGEPRAKDFARILRARDDGQELWPEWKALGRREGRTARVWSEQEMAKLWHWMRRRALVEECASKDGNFWPAWSMVWGMACVTQTRWATIASDDDDGDAIILNMVRERQGNPDNNAMKKVTEETNPKKDPSVKLEELIKELMNGRLPLS
ncbi:hypothetical protein BFW01_g2612 [Lasiodiplodia theobromae]|uniref:4a-hydroxytetrahydrobiopterin dehydratase n=1 Tax=Lasiodiplodia theobromae TaxID=45133 RepID=A0A5N5DEL5_9PEZI|nr:uncharacterized protein LTHEOB_5506 [Lasiodiplodia theobromae]KAB2575910.1 hypothetical protein DBV05_g5439 [Lasiodiplodia theobromae]KAF4545095.1 hypothetical protein LTHEOB_5506 [Lasiodiplodia theobromae]KAF9631750.1 hypothetical protein BFW01_g2612 [Lasiodiplodia theobromae]